MFSRLLASLRSRRRAAAAGTGPLAPSAPVLSPIEAGMVQLRPCRPISPADGELPEPERYLPLKWLRRGHFIQQRDCVEMVLGVDDTHPRVVTLRPEHRVVTVRRGSIEFRRLLEIAVWDERPILRVESVPDSDQRIVVIGEIDPLGQDEPAQPEDATPDRNELARQALRELPDYFWPQDLERLGVTLDEVFHAAWVADEEDRIPMMLLHPPELFDVEWEAAHAFAGYWQASVDEQGSGTDTEPWADAAPGYAARYQHHERDEGERLQDWIEAQDDNDPALTHTHEPELAKRRPTTTTTVDPWPPAAQLSAKADPWRPPASEPATTSRRARTADAGTDDIDAIRARVHQLPDGMITDDDLARVGVTPEQFAQLVDADMERDAEQWRAEYAAEQEWTAAWRARCAAERAPDAVRELHELTDTEAAAGDEEPCAGQLARRHVDDLAAQEALQESDRVLAGEVLGDEEA